jgi:imidazolonepropionase
VGFTATDTLLIRGARQVVTLRGSRSARRGLELNQLGIIPDGALLIRKGVIEEVGPTRRVENLAAARRAVEINAAGRVVMPGFVDCHTHLLSAGDDLSAAAKAIRSRTGQRLQNRAQCYLSAMARHGTTTVEVKSGCGPDESAQTKLLRVIDALNDDPLHLVASLLVDVSADQLARDDGRSVQAVLEKLLPKARRRRQARFADVVWSDQPAAREFEHWYLALARRIGLSTKVHAEGAHVAGAVAAAIAHLASTIDHLEHITAEEAAQLAGSPTMAVLLPSTALVNGGKVPPVRKMIDAGVAVALGTNFDPHRTPTLNMQTVIGLACLHLGMLPAEAIIASTINAAHALGYGDRVGSLELQKSADVLLLNISDCRDLVPHLGANLVHLALKRGTVIYQEGEVAPRSLSRLKPCPWSGET